MNGEIFYTCDACRNKQDGRLSFCEECGYDTLTEKPTPPAVVREPVGYADGSRFHELREGRMNLALWADRSVYADTPLYTRPQPATPATVTDEDVERAQEAADLVFAKRFGTRPNTDEIDTAMTRAALESFANKEPTDENDAKPAIIAGVRDTLIVAANNPVSHGGLNGLQQIMRAQAERLRNIEQPGSSVQEYRRGLMDAQNALQTVANRHRSKTAVRAMQELLSKLISLYGEGAPAPAAEQGRIAVVDEPGCIARAALDTLARSGVVQNEARGVEGILSQEDCPICQRFADKFGPCGYHKRIAAAPEPVRVDGAK